MTDTPALHAGLPQPQDVLLHRAPMLLIDRIVECDADTLVAEVDVSPVSSFFCEDHGVPVWIAIEYMAQAVAALGGIQALRRGDPVPVGFLLGSQRFKTNAAYFPAGVTLRVSIVENVAATYGLGSFDGTVTAGNITVSARLSVLVKPGGDLDKLTVEV